MYSQGAWGGPVDPFILLKFLPYEGDQDPVVSLVMFEWKDEDLIGIYPSADATQVRESPDDYKRKQSNAIHRKLESASSNTSRPDSAKSRILESSSSRQTRLRNPRT